jgi:hypothetical protein
MSLPLVIWIYLAFGLMIVFGLIAFCSWLISALEKQNAKEDQKQSDLKYGYNKTKE